MSSTVIQSGQMKLVLGPKQRKWGSKHKRASQKGDGFDRSRLSHPRMVRPPREDQEWHRIKHPKFPSARGQVSMTRTQKRRWQRRRKEVAEQHEGRMEFRPRERGSRTREAEGEQDQVMHESEETGPQEAEESRQPKWPRAVVNMVYTLPNSFGRKDDRSAVLVSGLEDQERPAATLRSIEPQNAIRTVNGIHITKEGDGSRMIAISQPAAGLGSHLKPLYVRATLDGVPMSKVLVDNGAAINVLPTGTMNKLGKSKEDLVPTDVMVSSFVGDVTNTRGILPLNVEIGHQKTMSAFFVVESRASYNALLGRDWIHSARC